jgi:nucleotide-binding universal stress UspA family protein
MVSFGSILVPVDFSQACKNAMSRAFLVADEHGARVTLLHVINPSSVNGSRRRPRSPTDIEQEVEQARASLRRCAALCTDLDNVRVAQVVCVGDPVEEVALAARHADLLVMGARKLNPLRDFVFGAPIERLLRLARRPILLTRQPAQRRYRALLVPMQLTAYSDAVAQAAARLAPTAKLHLLHALPSHREPEVRSAEASTISTWLQHDRVRRKAALRMRSMAAFLKASDFTVRTDYGDLAQVTLATRDRIAADLIVACKDEQSSVVDFLLADTAQRMLADCRSDTLLVPRTWVAQGVTFGVVPRLHTDNEVTA